MNVAPRCQIRLVKSTRSKISLSTRICSVLHSVTRDSLVACRCTLVRPVVLCTTTPEVHNMLQDTANNQADLVLVHNRICKATPAASCQLPLSARSVTLHRHNVLIHHLNK
ncbi:unnamed protein product [Arctia plantaginis]|uniref:Uncharacterized protein n=1 Tax=Arctia plantaginis TaxID=874455 RepID=A0A8S1AWX3_ARCPL|nr:unnamed protein product [Arctia plantaginis]